MTNASYITERIKYIPYSLTTVTLNDRDILKQILGSPLSMASIL